MNNSASTFQPDLFAGQVIIVTGAGRGIGRAIANLFASLGGKIVLAELSDEGEQVANEIQAHGGQALFVRTDVSSEEQVKHLAEITAGRFGAVDVLINNAIYCPVATVLDMSSETWDRVISVNLRGAFLTCKAFLPGMLSRGGGKIINMVSTDAMPGLSAYIASKQGINGFSQSLHAEVVGKGVRVIAFAPGMVDTPAIRGIAPDLSKLLGMEEQQFLELSLHPAYEGLMPPEDAAAATALLAGLYMDEFDGELVDGYAVLERAGWIHSGVLPENKAEESPQSETTGQISVTQDARTEAAELCERLARILANTGDELDQLPVFARPMARSGFKKKAGLRLQDWTRNTADIILLLEGGKMDDNARQQLHAFHARLNGLSVYYRDVPAETARFTRDEQMLNMVRQTTRERLDVLQRLEAALQAL